MREEAEVEAAHTVWLGTYLWEKKKVALVKTEGGSRSETDSDGEEVGAGGVSDDRGPGEERVLCLRWVGGLYSHMALFARPACPARKI